MVTPLLTSCAAAGLLLLQPSVNRHDVSGNEVKVKELQKRTCTTE